ncbi:hypothetical protein BC940DRAFT_302875 [Gongronella butleri]|nr:hypothetical protein BC940DRAFT_302875 [Gongronella butleri]
MITISWNTRKFQVALTEEEWDTCTVRDLKEKCHRITAIPLEQIKLLAYGAVMKKDDAPLSQYGVREGSQLRLLASKGEQQQGLKTKLEEKTTLAELERIQAKLTDTLLPEIEAYQKEVQAHNSSASSRADDADDAKHKLITRGLYFGEVLMQVLFEFDGVACSPTFEKSRLMRKEGVKVSQELLERVDRIRDSIL